MRHLISLGSHCDVAFQLRMHGAENVPHFFDWLSVPTWGLIKIIAEDFDVFHLEDMEMRTDNPSHYPKDMATGISFFHQFPYIDGHVTADYHLFYANFIKNFKFQARRFRDYVRTEPVTLVRREINEAQALKLEQVFFQRFPGADARFLYLVHDNNEFTTPHGRARHIPRTRSSLGQPEVWVKLLTEEGLIGTPYRHSTAEILGASNQDHSMSIDNRFNEAELLSAIAGNPDHPLFPIELSRFYYNQGKFGQAENYALQSMAIAPDKPDAMHQLIMSRWRGNKQPASAAADQLVALNKTANTYGLLPDTAQALVEAGRYAEAAEYSIKAINQSPGSHRGYFLLARSRDAQGRFAEAERAIANAIHMWSKMPLYHQMRVRLLDQLNRPEHAIAAARKACEKTAHYQILVQLAGLLERAGKPDEALEAWQRALPVANNQTETVESNIARLQPEPDEDALQLALQA